jgi:hypothetical protein
MESITHGQDVNFSPDTFGGHDISEEDIFHLLSSLPLNDKIYLSACVLFESLDTLDRYRFLSRYRQEFIRS